MHGLSLLHTQRQTDTHTHTASSQSGVPPGVTGGRRAACLVVRSVFEPADEPRDDHREHGQDAGDRQADGSGWRGGDAVAVHKDQAHEQQHQHGQE